MAEHIVQSVEIKGKTVRVVCSCGWKSTAVTTETKAREQHDAHAKPKSKGKSRG